MIRALVYSLAGVMLAASAFLSGVVPAHAQAGVTGRPVSVCVARATPGMRPAAMFDAATGFRCDADQMQLGAGSYWARSEAFRLDGARNVRIGSLWQDRVTLYALYADGTILSRALDGVAVSRHIQLGAIIEQPLPARAAPLVRLLWHVEGAANLRGILVGARIATPAESVHSNLLMGGLYAAFAGLCVALLLYNLALWAALRHPFQLAYCAMVLCLLLYAFSSSGVLAWTWAGLANNDRLRINYFGLGCAAVAALAFARAFFEPRVFAGRLGRLCTIASGIMLAAALAFALLAPWRIGLLDRVYAYAFVGQMLVVVPILWRAWRTRSSYLWIFGIAWAAPIAMAAVRVSSAFDMVGWNFWIDNSTILTMTIEAVLSSLAIAYRMRLLSVERDEARASEIAARLLADTDPLTGLLNRRAFLAQAIGREGAQTLMIADLDHFKHVNETIGHDGGDEVLRIIARTLRKAVPPNALVARLGGEEFAIVTPTSDDIAADDLLALLRAGRMPFDVAVTASIGTCTGPLLREADWAALYSCADRALFEAKTGGRDRVRRRRLPNLLAA